MSNSRDAQILYWNTKDSFRTRKLNVLCLVASKSALRTEHHSGTHPCSATQGGASKTGACNRKQPVGTDSA